MVAKISRILFALTCRGGACSSRDPRNALNWDLASTLYAPTVGRDVKGLLAILSANRLRVAGRQPRIRDQL